MKQNNSMKRKLKEDNAMSETSNSSLLFSTCEEVLTKDASSNTVSSKKTLGNKNSKTTKNRLLSEPAHIREVPVDNNDLALAFESFPYCNAALNNYIRTYLEQKGKNDAKQSTLSCDGHAVESATGRRGYSVGDSPHPGGAARG